MYGVEEHSPNELGSVAGAIRRGTVCLRYLIKLLIKPLRTSNIEARRLASIIYHVQLCLIIKKNKRQLELFLESNVEISKLLSKPKMCTLE